MDTPLVDIVTVIEWFLEDFWLSLVLATALLVFRVFGRRAATARSSRWVTKRDSFSLARSRSATAVPILVWGLEANRVARLVAATHVSVSPRMLLGSMQELLIAIVALGVIVGFDLLGRFVEARRTGLPLVGLSTVLVGVSLLVVADWLFSQVGWWALISARYDLP